MKITGEGIASSSPLLGHGGFSCSHVYPVFKEIYIWISAMKKEVRKCVKYHSL